MSTQRMANAEPRWLRVALIATALAFLLLFLALPLLAVFAEAFSGGFSAAQAQQIEDKIAKKLGATILKVRLTVLGGQLTPDTSFWSGGKVSTRAAASFVDFVSRYAFITPEGNKARVALGEIAETGPGALQFLAVAELGQ